jgi:cell division GTPase FtsZ
VSINAKKLDISELKPRITIFGVGGAGGNAVNNMINAGSRGSTSSFKKGRQPLDLRGLRQAFATVVRRFDRNWPRPAGLR